MFSKRSRLLLTLLAAVGIPYVWFNERFSKWLTTEAFSSAPTTSSSALTSSLMSSTVSAAQPAETSADGQAAPAATPSSLEEVLRFDITPNWVIQRWPRVSTVQSEQYLEGLRVAVVTGTALDDVAGSLTYYFDKKGQVQRLILHGRTGDDRKLVQLVGAKFGLHSEPTFGAGMYVARWNAIPTSVLRVSFAPVVRSDRPHTRLQVLLEINRPEAFFGLSQEVQAVLLHDRGADRW
jgi:hypothetical protein